MLFDRSPTHHMEDRGSSVLTANERSSGPAWVARQTEEIISQCDDVDRGELVVLLGQT